MSITTHQPWEWEDPLVLVGFPSKGVVGSIVASYLVPQLDMELVATMDSPHFPPTASVRDGVAVGPVQIYASRQRCGLDGECSQLVVVRSDAVPPGAHADEVAHELLDWSRSVGAETVVVLEAVRGKATLDQVFAVPNLHAPLDHERIGAKPFPSGAIAGLAAALLTEGNALEQEVLCLVTGVTDEQPDAGAAARLVDVVDELVPGIAMDSEPLEKRAQELEEELKDSLREQEETAHAQMMYL